MGNAEQPIKYALFLFTIKKEHRESVKLRASSQPVTLSTIGDLRSMAMGHDYVDFDQGLVVPGTFAEWRMNTELYNIVASRRGTISTWPGNFPITASGGQDTNYKFVSNSTLDDCNKDHRIKIKWKRKLKSGVGYTEAVGNPPVLYPNNWRKLNEVSVADSDQLYCVLFHNAIHSEQSPLIVSESIEFLGKEPQ